MTGLLLFGAACLVLGLGALAAGVLRHRRYRYVADLPTVAARATPAGLSEVKGRAVAAEEPFDSPFREEPAVLCHYAFYGRTASRDGWSPPEETGTLGVPFYVEDETGRILVRPEGAEIGLPEHLTEFSTREEPIEELEPEVAERYKERRRSGALPELGGGRAETANALYGLSRGETGPPAGPSRGAELRLEEGDEVYVLGSARPREAEAGAGGRGGDGDAGLVIAADPEEGGAFGRIFGSVPYLSAAYGSIFEIYAGPEEELLARHRSELRKGLAFGFGILAVGLVFVLAPLLGGGGP